MAASDGVFEKLNVQDVCDLLWEVRSYDSGRSELSSSCSYSLADCIVNTAFEKGSMDNVAAVVVPLVSTGFSESLLKERSVGEGDIKYTASGLQSTHEGSGGSLVLVNLLLDLICIEDLESHFVGAQVKFCCHLPFSLNFICLTQ